MGKAGVTGTPSSLLPLVAVFLPPRQRPPKKRRQWYRKTSHADAARMGGAALLSLYGTEHMRELGRKSAAVRRAHGLGMSSLHRVNAHLTDQEKLALQRVSKRAGVGQEKFLKACLLAALTAWGEDVGHGSGR